MVLQPYSSSGSAPPVDPRRTALVKAAARAEMAGAQDPEVLRLALSDVTVQLARALRSKDEILQNVSHELRSPLTLIIGYAETLSDEYWGGLTEGQSKAAAVILDQGRRLQSLIERLLRLQTLDDGTSDRIPVVFDELLERVAERWRPQIAQAGGFLVVDYVPGLPAVLCDPDMLVQAFDDLLDNAVKFGLRTADQTDTTSGLPPGAGRRPRLPAVIRLSAQLRDGWVQASVTDFGAGIPKEEIEQIFDRFYQVDRGLTRSSGGVGIGLALVKSIVHAHGGIVRVRSEGANQGSTFTVSLPVAIGNVAEVERPVSPGHHSLT